MSMRCLNCGRAVDPTHKFCSNCGHAVLATKTENAERPDAAEHRQLTILFSDIVGSVPLTEQLGAEVYREMLSHYREQAAQIFKRYGGQVARYIGDATLVYFGYPTAHENDAQRAIHAALELLALTKELSRIYHHSWSVDLQLRVAAHTGKVVAGDIRSESAIESMAIVGDAVNVAARLQQVCEPGSVVISRDTYQLIGRAFRCSALGPQSLKGVSRPVDVYRVESRRRERVIARPNHQTTRLIGRDRELGALKSAWHESAAGHGQVRVVRGEAGVGKSRLIAELIKNIDRRTSAQIALQCSEIFQNTALSPLIEFIRSTVGLDASHTAEEKIRRLELISAARDLDPKKFLPIFAQLLSIALPEDRYPKLELTPQEHKERILSGICQWLQKEASRRPLLLVVEDLHWADPSTIELLHALGTQIKNAKILLVLSSRQKPTIGDAEAEIVLSGLGQADALRMMSEIMQAQELPTALVEELFAKSDGLPLYIEELTRAMLEAAPFANTERFKTNRIFDIPSTLQESLAGRIDRVGVDREILHLCASLGRSFEFDLLAALWSGDRALLRRELDKLTDADILEPESALDASKFRFHHALVQDAIYHLLLSSSRQKHHARISEVLVASFPDLCERTPEVVAHHYLSANQSELALPYLQSAANKAIQGSAHIEASRYLRTALAVVRAMASGVERTQLELRLLVKLGVVLTATQSYSSPEVGTVFEQARQLCTGLAPSVSLFPVLHGLYRYYWVRAEVATALALSNEMLAIARECDDADLLIEADRAAGNCHFMLGDLRTASSHLTDGIARCNQGAGEGHHLTYGIDAFVGAAAQQAIVVALLGDGSRAEALSNDAIATAERLDHPFGICWALAWGAVTAQIVGNQTDVNRRADRLLEQSDRHRFPFWHMHGLIMHGYDRNLSGANAAAGIQSMREGIAGLQQIGAFAFVPYYLSLLADAFWRDGSNDQAIIALEEARQLGERNREVWWLAEIYRLLFIFSISFGASSTSMQMHSCHASIDKALEIARAQRAELLLARIDKAHASAR